MGDTVLCMLMKQVQAWIELIIRFISGRRKIMADHLSVGQINVKICLPLALAFKITCKCVCFSATMLTLRVQY